MRRAAVLMAAVLMLSVAVAGQTVIDDFEDGDVQEWTGDKNEFTATSSNAIAGTYSGKMVTESGDEYVVERSFSSSGLINFSYKWKGLDQYGDSSNEVRIRLDSGGNSIGRFRFRGNGDVRIGTPSSSSFEVVRQWNTDVVYSVNVVLNFRNDEVEYYINGALEATHDMTTGYNENFELVYEQNSGSLFGDPNKWRTFIDDIEIEENTAPEFNNTSVSTDPLLIGQYANYSADVYDPDGSIQYTNLSLNGVCSATDLQRSGTAPEWNGVCTPSGTGWLNATFETVDDAGAVTTAELDRKLTDTAPNVSLLQPNNRTYLSYDKQYKVRIQDDADSDPDEQVTCDLWNNSNRFVTKQARESDSQNSRTFTGTLRNDIGQHTFTAQCSDGQTTNKSVRFSVDALVINDTTADGPVRETVAKQYNASLFAGDMVNDFSANLIWNNTVRSTRSENNSGVTKYELNEAYAAVLTETNDTSVDWLYNASFNRTLFGGASFTTETASSVTASVDLWQGFYFINSSLDDGTVLESNEYKHRFWMQSVTDKPGFSPRNVYWRDTSTITPEATIDNNRRRYTSQQKVGNVSSLNKDYKTSTDVVIGYNGDSRTIRQASNDTVTVQQFRVAPCSSNKANETAISFNTFKETDRATTVTSTLDVAFNYWVGDKNLVKTVNASSSNTGSHTFCMEPDDASITVQGTRQKGIYSADSYSTRSVYLLKQTIDNTTTNIPLYLLNQSESTSVTFQLEGSDGDPAADRIMSFERYFPSDNANIRVAMARTGSNGETISNLAVGEEQDYQITVYDLNSSVVDLFPNQVITQSPVELELGVNEIVTYLDRAGLITHACSTTRSSIECTYSAPSSLDTITLDVDRQTVFNITDKCTASSTSPSGQLVCDQLNLSTDKYEFRLTAEFDNGDTVLVETGEPGTLDASFGAAGLFTALLVVITLGLAGAFSPTAGILLSGIGVFVSYATGLLAIGAGSVVSIVLVGAILVWRMNSR